MNTVQEFKQEFKQTLKKIANINKPLKTDELYIFISFLVVFIDNDQEHL